jgi:hypothetical protein
MVQYSGGGGAFAATSSLVLADGAGTPTTLTLYNTQALGTANDNASLWVVSESRSTGIKQQPKGASRAANYQFINPAGALACDLSYFNDAATESMQLRVGASPTVAQIVRMDAKTGFGYTAAAAVSGLVAQVNVRGTNGAAGEQLRLSYDDADAWGMLVTSAGSLFMSGAGSNSFVQITPGSGANAYVMLGGSGQLRMGDASNFIAVSASGAMSLAGTAHLPMTVPGTVAVSALPASPGAGYRAFVTDALSPVFGSAVVGGGAIGVPVYHDGASWKVG